MYELVKKILCCVTFNTASMITLCILEVAAYYLYNRKVSRHSYNKQVLYLFSVPPLGEDH